MLVDIAAGRFLTLSSRNRYTNRSHPIHRRASNRYRSNLEFQSLKVTECISERPTDACDRPGIDSERILARYVPNGFDGRTMFMSVADEIVVTCQCHRPGVMRVVDQEYAPLRQLQVRVLPIIVDMRVLLHELGKVEQVARIVAVNQVDRQAQVYDRVQSGGRHQIAAVQHYLSAKRFGLLYSGGKRFAVVVAVGDNADFQATPPRALYPMPYEVFSMVA